MKLLLVILTILIILISIFLISLNKNLIERRCKRHSILNPRLKKPKTRSVSFADEIVQSMPIRTFPMDSRDRAAAGWYPSGGSGGHGSSSRTSSCTSTGHSGSAGPILIDEYGQDQLLKFDAFVDNYYSQKDITKFKQVYEAEALDVSNRYALEDFVYKKESERFQFQ